VSRVSRHLLAEIWRNAETPEEARAMLRRLNAHLDGFASWRPYVPPAAIRARMDTPDREEDG
jgi:hypothetical protein